MAYQSNRYSISAAVSSVTSLFPSPPLRNTPSPRQQTRRAKIPASPSCFPPNHCGCTRPLFRPLRGPVPRFCPACVCKPRRMCAAGMIAPNGGGSRKIRDPGRAHTRPDIGLNAGRIRPPPPMDISCSGKGFFSGRASFFRFFRRLFPLSYEIISCRKGTRSRSWTIPDSVFAPNAHVHDRARTWSFPEPGAVKEETRWITNRSFTNPERWPV